MKSVSGGRLKELKQKKSSNAIMNCLNLIMLGGVEELYERLVLQKEEIDTDYSDDKTANLMMLFERFAPKKTS